MARLLNNSCPMTTAPKILLLLVSLSLTACAPVSQGGSQRPTWELPSYSGQEIGLFDDSLAEAIFGLSIGITEPDEDLLLAQRVALADSVMPVRLMTLNEDARGGVVSYQLVLNQQGDALLGVPLAGPLSVTLSHDNPSVTFLRAASSRLVGTTMILLMRHYNQDGVPVVHFRAEADSQAVRNAIERAKLFRELGS